MSGWVSLISLLHLIVYSVNSYPLCDLQVLVERTIDEEGFHRVLKIDVGVDGHFGVLLKNWGCNLAIHQRLPSSVFVDREELNQLASFNKQSWVNFYYLNESIDVEASAEVSPWINVFIMHGEDDGKVAQSGSDLIKYHFTLPMHVRYHAPHFLESYRDIALPSPAVLFRCTTPDVLPSHCFKRFACDLPCDATGDSDHQRTVLCDSWYMIPPHKAKTGRELSINVPVGDMKQLFLVQLITMGVTNLGSIYIVYYLLYVHQ